MHGDKVVLVHSLVLTVAQQRLIKGSYLLIGEHEYDFSELFYYRLKEDYPFARALFPDDMTRQIELFRAMIDILVEQVDKLSALRPTLTALAQRHLAYGVLEQHYASVGATLIETFAQMLGRQFTSEVKEAWLAVYAATAGVMIEDAYRPRPAASQG